MIISSQVSANTKRLLFLSAILNFPSFFKRIPWNLNYLNKMQLK